MSSLNTGILGVGVSVGVVVDRNMELGLGLGWRLGGLICGCTEG